MASENDTCCDSWYAANRRSPRESGTSQRAPPRFIEPSNSFANRVSSGDRRQRLELGLEFGDNDGFLDAYIVNGMIAVELFEHLPGDELVEENQAFRNVQGTRFVPAPEWGLGARESGRGMSMADLDVDGDLDIVINNLASPARLFENRLCGGDHVQMDLRWPAAANRYAVGAQVRLETSTGNYLRTVRAAGGYLSGDAPRLHFGVPDGSRLLAARIVWPDGKRSVLRAPTLNHLITVTRQASPNGG